MDSHLFISMLHRMQQRLLNILQEPAFKEFVNQCERDLKDAHRALSHAIAHLEAQPE
jgi:hypothetical protein